MKINFNQLVDNFFGGSGFVAQILPPAQVVHPQRTPDYIYSQRDREQMPKTTLWQDIQDWSYMPVTFRIGSNELSIDRINLLLVGGALLGYAGLGIYMKRFFK